MLPSRRSFFLFFCAGCATPDAPPPHAAVAATTAQTPAVRLDHDEPVLAKCVADAYARAGATEMVDGVISVDSTGRTPRYDVDPKLPGLLDCVIAAHVPLARHSTSFRVRRNAGVIEVASVPGTESGDEEYEVPPEVPIGVSACMLKQSDLRAPSEGAMLLRLRVAPGGVIENIAYIASTAQFDASARACLPDELAEHRIEGIDAPTVINLKHHVRIGPPVD